MIPFLLLLAGCGKENAVDASTHVEGAVGAQCTCANDPACGVAAVCVLGWCRSGCTTDTECPQGALCVGDQVPFGCTLPDEGDCSAKACPPGLACGIDKRCRLPCTKDTDCPRNEHVCIASTCVSKNEKGADQTWFLCTPGAKTVHDPLHPMSGCTPASTIQGCDEAAPGIATVHIFAQHVVLQGLAESAGPASQRGSSLGAVANRVGEVHHGRDSRAPGI